MWSEQCHNKIGKILQNISKKMFLFFKALPNADTSVVFPSLHVFAWAMELKISGLIRRPAALPTQQLVGPWQSVGPSWVPAMTIMAAFTRRLPKISHLILLTECLVSFGIKTFADDLRNLEFQDLLQQCDHKLMLGGMGVGICGVCTYAAVAWTTSQQ